MKHTALAVLHLRAVPHNPTVAHLYWGSSLIVGTVAEMGDDTTVAEMADGDRAKSFAGVDRRQRQRAAILWIVDSLNRGDA